MAFFESDFASNHLVAGGGVALKLDATHVKLLTFVHVNFEVHNFLLVIELGVGDRSEVDVAEFAVGFTQILEPLGDFFAGEDVAVFDCEQAAERFLVSDGLVVLESDGTETVSIAFFDGHGDIDGLTRALLEERNVEPGMAGVVDIGFGIVHQHFEIAAVLVLGANTLYVFVELGGVIGLGKKAFQEDGVRDADRLQVLHSRNQSAIVDVFVPLEANLSHFHLGAFADHKGQAHRSRGDGTNLAPDSRKLAAVLSQQLLQGDFRLLDLGGIVLALHRESDLALLETIEDVAGRDGTQAGVVDFADGRALFNIDVEHPAFWSLLTLETDVLEIARVPEGVEVALNGGQVVDIANMGENA